jgi:glycosyltransferase involved in cell wall biosynthesis
MKIKYHADLSPSGYGMAARGYIQAFKAIGIGPEDLLPIATISAIPGAADVGNDPGDRWLINKYQRPRDFPAEGCVIIVHLHPPVIPRIHDYCRDGCYNIAITAWETDKLPAVNIPDSHGRNLTTANHLNRFNEVWVPTLRVKEALIRSGAAEVPIFVIPHAILPALLTREPRVGWPKVPEIHPHFGEEGEVVQFYYIGSWDERKNTEALLEAYFLTGWTPADPVEFHFHCVPAHREMGALLASQDRVATDLQRIVNAMPKPQDLPLFSPHTSPKTYSDVLDFHSQGHVFITASRGEGFCLPALEALAMGNLIAGPKTVLGHFGEAVFCPVPDRSVPVRAMSDVFGYELGQKWHEPSPDGLVSMFEESFKAVKQGALNQRPLTKRIRDEYSPEAIGGLIKQRLEKIEGDYG